MSRENQDKAVRNTSGMTEVREEGSRKLEVERKWRQTERDLEPGGSREKSISMEEASSVKKRISKLSPTATVHQKHNKLHFYREKKPPSGKLFESTAIQNEQKKKYELTVPKIYVGADDELRLGVKSKERIHRETLGTIKSQSCLAKEALNANLTNEIKVKEIASKGSESGIALDNKQANISSQVTRKWFRVSKIPLKNKSKKKNIAEAEGSVHPLSYVSRNSNQFVLNGKTRESSVLKKVHTSPIKVFDAIKYCDTEDVKLKTKKDQKIQETRSEVTQMNPTELRKRIQLLIESTGFNASDFVKDILLPDIDGEMSFDRKDQASKHAIESSSDKRERERAGFHDEEICTRNIKMEHSFKIVEENNEQKEEHDFPARRLFMSFSDHEIPLGQATSGQIHLGDNESNSCSQPDDSEEEVGSSCNVSDTGSGWVRSDDTGCSLTEPVLMSGSDIFLSACADVDVRKSDQIESDDNRCELASHHTEIESDSPDVSFDTGVQADSIDISLGDAKGDDVPDEQETVEGKEEQDTDSKRKDEKVKIGKRQENMHDTVQIAKNAEERSVEEDDNDGFDIQEGGGVNTSQDTTADGFSLIQTDSAVLALGNVSPDGLSFDLSSRVLKGETVFGEFQSNMDLRVTDRPTDETDSPNKIEFALESISEINSAMTKIMEMLSQRKVDSSFCSTDYQEASPRSENFSTLTSSVLNETYLDESYTSGRDIEMTAFPEGSRPTRNVLDKRDVRTLQESISETVGEGDPHVHIPGQCNHTVLEMEPPDSLVPQVDETSALLEDQDFHNATLPSSERWNQEILLLKDAAHGYKQKETGVLDRQSSISVIPEMELISEALVIEADKISNDQLLPNWNDSKTICYKKEDGAATEPGEVRKKILAFELTGRKNETVEIADRPMRRPTEPKEHMQRKSDSKSSKRALENDMVETCNAALASTEIDTEVCSSPEISSDSGTMRQQSCAGVNNALNSLSTLTNCNSTVVTKPAPNQFISPIEVTEVNLDDKYDPESAMEKLGIRTAKSEINFATLPIMMSFAFSMENLNNDTLTISFVGDSIDITSSKTLTSFEIAYSRKGTKILSLHPSKAEKLEENISRENAGDDLIRHSDASSSDQRSDFGNKFPVGNEMTSAAGLDSSCLAKDATTCSTQQRMIMLEDTSSVDTVNEAPASLVVNPDLNHSSLEEPNEEWQSVSNNQPFNDLDETKPKNETCHGGYEACQSSTDSLVRSSSNEYHLEVAAAITYPGIARRNFPERTHQKFATSQGDNYFPYFPTTVESTPAKILFIGSSSTGKTSLIRRYVKNTFTPSYRATIGADFLVKVVHLDQKTTYRLQLWDIAGQDRFSLLSRAFYRDAVGAFVVSDLTRQESLEAVIHWKEELDAKIQGPSKKGMPCYLLGNKCDLLEDTNTQSKNYENICRDYGFQGWMQTSAKNDINVTESIEMLLRQITEKNAIKNEDSFQETFVLVSDKQRKKYCLC